MYVCNCFVLYPVKHMDCVYVLVDNSAVLPGVLQGGLAGEERGALALVFGRRKGGIRPGWVGLHI